jgi:molecular chaperone GrpE
MTENDVDPFEKTRSEEFGDHPQQTTVRVNDRRRFDPDGTPRSGADEDRREARADSESPPSASLPRSAESARLNQELEVARKRVDELARAFQALSNDREDFKQRLNREHQRLLEVEKGDVALTLIEVLDELERSLNAYPNDESPLTQGVKLIRDKILSRLQSMGIERLDPLGQPFDPHSAEATDLEMTTDPSEDQKVVAVSGAGYRLKDRVIRPAKVKVAKYVKPADA